MNEFLIQEECFTKVFGHQSQKTYEYIVFYTKLFEILLVLQRDAIINIKFKIKMYTEVTRHIFCKRLVYETNNFLNVLLMLKMDPLNSLLTYWIIGWLQILFSSLWNIYVRIFFKYIIDFIYIFSFVSNFINKNMAALCYSANEISNRSL